MDGDDKFPVEDHPDDVKILNIKRKKFHNSYISYINKKAAD